MPPRAFSSRAWVCSAVPPIFEEIRSDSVASTKRNSSPERTPASKSTCPNRRATVVFPVPGFPIKAACRVCFSGALPLAIRFLLNSTMLIIFLISCLTFSRPIRLLSSWRASCFFSGPESLAVVGATVASVVCPVGTTCALPFATSLPTR